MLYTVRDLRRIFLSSRLLNRLTGRSAMLMVFALGCSEGTVCGEIIVRKVQAGKSCALDIDVSVDDAGLRDPRGYGQHGVAMRHFSRRITLVNSGAVPLTGRLLIVDGQDWSSVDKLRDSLHLPAEPRLLVERFYTFWKDSRSHASSGSKASEHPVGALNFWGYTYCGEDSEVLARFFEHAGIPGRRIALNGHTVAEYFYDGGWHVIDGDQNVCYHGWDNRTLASAADIAADPLIALRTKVFGKHSPKSLVNSAFNTSLFEYIDPRERKPLKHKTPDIALRHETLLPGEKLIFHHDRSPENPAGTTNILAWEGLRESALCLVEWVIDPALRSNAEGEVSISSAYPIVGITAQGNGESFPVPPGEPVFDLTIKPKPDAGPISVYCQRSRVSFPRIHKGTTQLAIDAKDPRGEATISVEFERFHDPIGLAPKIQRREGAGPLPEFEIDHEPDVNRHWWQVATSADFRFVIPNFDSVSAPIKNLVFDPLTATFFNRGETYFLRVKARRKGTEGRGGTWGEWSSPVEFRVDVPMRPTPVVVEALPQGNLRLSWPKGEPATEYLVFGSHRLDFVPEVYATEEIVALRNGQLEQSRPNKNLVAVVSEAKFETIPEYRFYRVIARKNGALSPPSDLAAVPVSIAGNLPPAIVLQARWKRLPDPKAKNGYVDLYISSELPLPAIRNVHQPYTKEAEPK
ncbi:MAG: hypothetical protein JWL59_2029 [Chthoniobacteraceae bacterium]|nr:hypothetical protein [Chthoniobacteraceae bacterium]